MKTTNEVLASFAEGKLTQEERVSVRQDLARHPRNMELVMMMMDRDYELTLDKEQAMLEAEGIPVIDSDGLASPLLTYSAAAFAPQQNAQPHIIDVPGHADNEGFDQRLDALLSDLDEMI